VFFEQDIQNPTLKTAAKKINLKEISSHLFGRERFLELAIFFMHWEALAAVGKSSLFPATE